MYLLQEAWASDDHALSQFLYYTYNKTDFDLIKKYYSYSGWEPGFHKDNATLYAHINSSLWDVQLNKLYQHKCKLSIFLYISIDNFKSFLCYLVFL